MHGLRHPLLPPGLPARQPHPRLERPRLPGRLARGHRPPARHEQLPGVHRHAVPRPVRGLLRARDQRRPGHDQGDRAADHRPRVRRGLGRAPSPRPSGPGSASRSSAPGPPGSPPPSSSAAPATTSRSSSAPTGSAGSCATASPSSRWRSASSTGVSRRWRRRASRFVTGAARGRRRGPASASARSTTRSSWPAAPAHPRDLPIPGRELGGIHFAMEYLPLQNRRCEGDVIPGGGLHHGAGQARGHHRRRRHRRGLPRHRAPPGRALGPPVRDPARGRPTSARPTTRGPSSRTSTGSRRPTRRAGSASTPSSTKRFLGDDRGRVRGLEAVRVEVAREGGRPVFREVPGSEFTLPCELVLLAMGFLGPERPGMLEKLGVAPHRARQRLARRRAG